MLNNAFWFFYWVDALAAFTVLSGVITGVSGFLIVIFGVGAMIESDAKILRFAWRALPVFCVATLLVIFIPSRTAMYAGAGQYVAEVTEVDDTLLQLKELIDQRIAEELEE